MAEVVAIKPQIALEQLRWACTAGLPRGVVLMDAGYGADTDLRATITTLVAGLETLIVVSSDLSHYHSYEAARRLDLATAAAIEKGD
jgi:AmmeMemoRadiSam system protein B